MKWLTEAITNPYTNRASTHRVIALAAGFSLSISTLLLTVIVFWRPEVAAPLSTMAPSLAGLAGSGYWINKKTNAEPKYEQPG